LPLEGPEWARNPSFRGEREIASTAQKGILNDVPIFALISQLAATGQVHCVRRDNWKVGRLPHGD
jgi:hypothetical protein